MAKMAGTSASVLLRTCIGRSLSAQRSEQVGDGGPVPPQRLDAADARSEKSPLRVDDVELARHAVLVSQAGEAQRLGERPPPAAFGFQALRRAPPPPGR